MRVLASYSFPNLQGQILRKPGHGSSSCKGILELAQCIPGYGAHIKATHAYSLGEQLQVCEHQARLSLLFISVLPVTCLTGRWKAGLVAMQLRTGCTSTWGEQVRILCQVKTAVCSLLCYNDAIEDGGV